MERLSNTWMKMTRGDIAQRFDKIKDTYLDVQKDTKTQIEKERLILEAYMDFRGALKNSEVLALDVHYLAEFTTAMLNNYPLGFYSPMTYPSGAITALRKNEPRFMFWKLMLPPLAACQRPVSAP